MQTKRCTYLERIFLWGLKKSSLGVSGFCLGLSVRSHEEVLSSERSTLLSEPLCGPLLTASGFFPRWETPRCLPHVSARRMTVRRLLRSRRYLDHNISLFEIWPAFSSPARGEEAPVPREAARRGKRMRYKRGVHMPGQLLFFTLLFKVLPVVPLQFKRLRKHPPSVCFSLPFFRLSNSSVTCLPAVVRGDVYFGCSARGRVSVEICRREASRCYPDYLV